MIAQVSWQWLETLSKLLQHHATYPYCLQSFKVEEFRGEGEVAWGMGGEAKKFLTRREEGEERRQGVAC